MKKAILLYNPAAGRFPLSPKRINRMLEKLHGIGIATEAVATCPPSESQALDLAGKNLLIVCGGDGTIHGAIPEAIRWKVPLAVIPAGTANVLAREIGIPRTAERAIEVIRRGRLRRIYLGRGQERYFHLMAGVGVDAYVIERIKQGFKRALGVGSYWLTGFRSFWSFPLQPFQVEMEGETHPATFAVISKSRFYGGHLLLAPRASVFDAQLDVCLFQSTDRVRFLSYLLGGFTGKHVDYPDVVYRKTRRAIVRGDESIPVQMDGDVIGHAPMEFAVSEDSIEVVVP